jgi:hypothetical protein
MGRRYHDKTHDHGPYPPGKRQAGSGDLVPRTPTRGVATCRDTASLEEEVGAAVKLTRHARDAQRRASSGHATATPPPGSMVAVLRHDRTAPGCPSDSVGVQQKYMP